MKIAVLAACLLCFSVPSFAAKQQECHNAMVISQNVDSYNAGAAAIPIGGMLVAVPITRSSNFVVVETATHRLTLSERVTGKGAIILSVKETIQLCKDDKWFIVLDSNNKKHKFSLQHIEAIGDQK